MKKRKTKTSEDKDRGYCFNCQSEVNIVSEGEIDRCEICRAIIGSVKESSEERRLLQD